MKKFAQVLLATIMMSTTFALPAQAAIIVGGPNSYSGSVITLHSYMFSGSGSSTQVTSSGGTQVTVPTPTPTPTPAPTPTPTTTSGSSVISLKNILIRSYGTTTTTQSPTPVTPTPTQPTPTPTPTPVPTPTQPTSTTIPMVTALTPDEQSMVDMINQERAAAGLQPLQVDLRLASVARAKANDMKTNNYFGHTSPTFGTPWAMMAQVGLNVQWAGENIAGNKSVAGAMAALMSDSGHRANILDPKFTHVGIGVVYGSAYGTLYVQEFAQE